MMPRQAGWIPASCILLFSIFFAFQTYQAWEESQLLTEQEIAHFRQTKKEFIGNYRLAQENFRREQTEALQNLFPPLAGMLINRYPESWHAELDKRTGHLLAFHAVRIKDARGELLHWSATGDAAEYLDPSSKANGPSHVMAETATMPRGPYRLEVLVAPLPPEELYFDELDKLDLSHTGINGFGRWINQNPIRNAFREANLRLKNTLLWTCPAILLLAFFAIWLHKNLRKNKRREVFYSTNFQLLRSMFARIPKNEFKAIQPLAIQNPDYVSPCENADMGNLIADFNNAVVPFCEHLAFARALSLNTANHYIALTNNAIVKDLNRRTATILRDFGHDTKKLPAQYTDRGDLQQEIKRRSDALYRRLIAWPERQQDIIVYLNRWIEHHSVAFGKRDRPELILEERDGWPKHFRAVGVWEFFEAIMEKIYQNSITANEEKLRGRGYGKLYIQAAMDFANAESSSRSQLHITVCDEGGGINDREILKNIYQAQVASTKPYGEGIGSYLAGWFARLQGWQITAENTVRSDGHHGLKTYIVIPQDIHAIEPPKGGE